MTKNASEVGGRTAQLSNDLLLFHTVDRAIDRVVAAIEAGASEPEAAAMYRDLTRSIGRHPSAGRPAA